MLRDIGYVEGSIGCVPSGIWPNGLRYLWTDAFEVVLYLALYRTLGHQSLAAAA